MPIFDMDDDEADIDAGHDSGEEQGIWNDILPCEQDAEEWAHFFYPKGRMASSQMNERLDQVSGAEHLQRVGVAEQGEPDSDLDGYVVMDPYFRNLPRICGE